jgi:hypothetical protein
VPRTMPWWDFINCYSLIAALIGLYYFGYLQYELLTACSASLHPPTTILQPWHEFALIYTCAMCPSAIKRC